MKNASHAKLLLRHIVPFMLTHHALPTQILTHFLSENSFRKCTIENIFRMQAKYFSPFSKRWILKANMLGMKTTPFDRLTIASLSMDNICNLLILAIQK